MCGIKVIESEKPKNQTVTAKSSQSQYETSSRASCRLSFEDYDRHSVCVTVHLTHRRALHSTDNSLNVSVVSPRRNCMCQENVVPVSRRQRRERASAYQGTSYSSGSCGTASDLYFEHLWSSPSSLCERSGSSMKRRLALHVTSWHFFCSLQHLSVVCSSAWPCCRLSRAIVRRGHSVRCCGVVWVVVLSFSSPRRVQA